MKAYKKMVSLCLGVFMLLAVGVNVYLYATRGSDNHDFQVDINRIQVGTETQENSFYTKGNVERWYMEQDFPYTNGFVYMPKSDTATEEMHAFMNGEDVAGSNLFRVFEIEQNGKIKGFGRVTYPSEYANVYRKTAITANLILASVFVVVVVIFLYLGWKVFHPFAQLSDAPVQLAKGHYKKNLKDQKSQYFGRFLWGMDMLRETLEDSKDRELELEKEKKMMVLSISHDIKTPLSAIRLYAKALKDGLYKNPEKVQDTYDKIDEKVMQIEGMVSDLISMSTSNIRNISVGESDFYLHKVVDEFTRNYKEKCALHHIDFQVDFFKDCLVHGDPDRLQEVLENLMENAMKYGDGRYIHISFDKEDGCQLIRVINSGEPVRGDDYVHLFDSFWRGENVGSKPGSGLGLYICKTIMNKMGGEIFPEKVGENEFCMTLVVR